MYPSSDSTHTSFSESVRASINMKLYINLLKDDLKDLKKDVSLLLRQRPASSTVPSTCHVKIILSHHTPLSASLLETDAASSLLGCSVLSVAYITCQD